MDLENLKQVWDEEKIESVPEISLKKENSDASGDDSDEYADRILDEYYFLSFVGCIVSSHGKEY